MTGPRPAARHALAGTVATALAALVALLAGLVLAGGPAASAPRALAAESAESVDIDDAVLAWGLNDESNNKAFAPGTFNFLSAGAVPDPGRGGQTIVAPGVWRGTSTKAWRSRAGSVLMQKRRSDGSWGSAGFAGLSADASGAPLTSTSGPFSGHRIVLTGGIGSADPAAGTARIDWPGSFSVVYYSGYSFFTVTNPSLVVTDGVGQLLGTVSGYAADRDDPEKWGPVPPQRVVLADLPAVVLPAEGGFSAQPAYVGVPYDGADQVRGCATCGSFPTSFVDYMDRSGGTAAFWYSSGSSADAHKVPQPISVAYDAGTPPDPTTAPTDVPTGAPTDVPTSEPTAGPTTTVNPTPPPPAVPTQPAGPALPAAPSAAAPPLPVPSGGPAVGAPALATPLVPDTVQALDAEVLATPSEPESSPWPWWLGGAMLLGAAALTVLTLRTSPSRGTP